MQKLLHVKNVAECINGGKTVQNDWINILVFLNYVFQRLNISEDTVRVTNNYKLIN